MDIDTAGTVPRAGLFAPDRTTIRRFYPEWDLGDKLLRSWLREVVHPTDRVLDAGAGTGQQFHHGLRGMAGEVVGLDLDPRVRENPQVDRGVVGSLEVMPFPASSFDVVFCRAVLEHVERPRYALAQIRRVLKPGGHFLLSTPNRWHYVALAAQATPNGFHSWFNERLRRRKRQETFPTLYRLNSPGKLRRLLNEQGFDERRWLLLEGEPSYMLWSWPSFLAGMAYGRLVESTERLSWARSQIVGHFG